MVPTTTPTPGRSRRWLRAFALAVVVAMPMGLAQCGVGIDGPGDPSGPSLPGPSVISPQPIPDNATGTLLDETSITGREVDGALVVRATVTSPFTGTTSLTVTNLNHDVAGIVVTVTFGEPFEVTLPGTLSDTVRVEETSAIFLARDLRFTADGQGAPYEPCFRLEGTARNVLLPNVDANTNYELTLFVENGCTEDVRVVEAHASHAATPVTIDLAPLTSPTFIGGASKLVNVPIGFGAAGPVSTLVVLTRSDHTATAVRLRGTPR